jgi:nucleoside 2-deoxyribosyltransferase
MKTFLICPVRGHDMSETQEVVDRLEYAGFDVYWPPRDTDQTDPIGLQICKDNRAAIEEADIVHIVWDGKSTGSLFDLGMAFALGKPVIPISLPPETEHKSFQNMIMAYYEELQWA